MGVKWTTEQIPNLHGHIAVVTGANSGIGYETARALAGKGARVVMAVRSRTNGVTAQTTILRQHRGAAVDVMELDLSSLASIEQFARQFFDSYPSLSLLVNNAGVMGVPYAQTKDGFELQFGTNHLGHFALTGRLLPRLLASDSARVVTVSSAAHLSAKVSFDNLQGERGYRRWSAYGQSKLANLLFMYELQRRFERHGANAISVASHPGWAATNLAKKTMGSRNAGLGKVLQAIFNSGAQSAAMGALPSLYAATDTHVHGGDYIGPTSMSGMRGHPGRAKSSERARDSEDAKRLWEISETLTGVHFAL